MHANFSEYVAICFALYILHHVRLTRAALCPVRVIMPPSREPIRIRHADPHPWSQPNVDQLAAPHLQRARGRREWALRGTAEC